jgi:hypothetical protein
MSQLINTSSEFQDYHAFSWDKEPFWLNRETPAEDRSQYFAVANSVNFRFWELKNGKDSPTKGVIDGKEFSGSMYMWRALYRSYHQDSKQFSAEHLAELDEEGFDKLFNDDNGHNPLSVGKEERIANLNDLGKVLNEKYDGKFINVIKASRGSLENFTERSREFRSFNDPVQKLTMVNAILHNGSGVADFKDQPFAGIDYHLLRHALRQGLVEPNPETKRKLENRESLDYEEGIELRRQTLLAFNQLSDKTGISGEILDNKYWLNRKNCSDEPVCLTDESKCPFSAKCKKLINYKLPIEKNTRYY